MLTYKLHTTSLVLDINLIPDSFPGVAVPNTGFFVTLSSEIQWRLGTTNRLLQQKCMQYAKTAEIQKKQQLDVLPLSLSTVSFSRKLDP